MLLILGSVIPLYRMKCVSHSFVFRHGVESRAQMLDTLGIVHMNSDYSQFHYTCIGHRLLD